MQDNILSQLEDAKLQNEVVATANKTKSALCPMQAAWILTTKAENPKIVVERHRPVVRGKIRPRYRLADCKDVR